MWVGTAAWHYGSDCLWGDVPALMPIAMKNDGRKGFERPLKNTPHYRFSSKSPERAFGSAMIARIPLPISQWIGWTYYRADARRRPDRDGEYP
jgi:hypothetical protein